MASPNLKYSFLVSLLLILLLVMISDGEAAIIQHQSMSRNSSQEDLKDPQDRNNYNYKPPQPWQKQQQQQRHESLPSKILILTTGDQIKLYPFVEQSDELSSEYYLIKPKPFGGSGRFDLLKYDKNLTFFRWNRYKDSRRIVSLLNKENQKKKSILPESQTDNNEIDSDYGGIWNKPNIADVDYFFNPQFCSTSDYVYSKKIFTEQCLVVVWLDKSNNYVRFGSLDLASTPLNDSDKMSQLPLKSNTTLSKKNKVLWLTEFTPIPVYGSSNKTDTGTIHGMAVDKKQLKLFIATTSSEGKQYITSTIFEGYTSDHIPGWSYPQIQLVPSCENFTGMSSLSIDESKSDWLFYSSRKGHTGDSINAVHQLREPASKANRALITYVDSNDEPKLETVRDGINIALEPVTRRLYWLTRTNELYSSIYLGLDIKFHTKLSHKPAIRSIEGMQIIGNTLYLSDPIKRSLISYKLPKPTPSEIYSNYYDGNDDLDFDGSGRSASVQDESLVEPTHTVLLVESPTIKGFRVIDLRKITVLANRMTSSGDVKQAKIYSLQSSFDEWQEEACSNLCNRFFPDLGATYDELEMIGECCLLIDRLNSCDLDRLTMSTSDAYDFCGLLITFIPPLILLTIYYYVSKRIRDRVVSEVPEKIPDVV